MKAVVRALSDLGDDLVLAPERWLAVDDARGGVPLGDLVVERRERVDARAAIVLDTTHAKDGLLDIAAAVRAGAAPKSAKKLARGGDLIVSRLRPYLRQIAVIHPGALAIVGGARPLAVSTEFYVLAPRDEGDDLGFLLPFLLGERAQAILAAAQEGGHHPRVPRSSLLALRVPDALVRQRRKLSEKVEGVLAALYGALGGYQALLDAAR
jgi:hypothetical protein